MKLETTTSNVIGWIKKHSNIFLIVGTFILSWFAVKQAGEEIGIKIWWGAVCISSLLICILLVADSSEANKK